MSVTDRFLETGLEAFEQACAFVQPYQTGIEQIPVSEVKLDRSLFSWLDEHVEDILTRLFQASMPGHPLQREEGGTVSGFENELILADPVDGSRPMQSGATGSTLILGLYDRLRRRLIASLTGEFSTGRAWIAREGEDMLLSSVAAPGVRVVRPCQVWHGQMSRSTTVLIDNFAGFPGALTDEGARHLFGNLQTKTAIQNYGSNGLHHALVAGGGDRVVGAITTSVGGAHDLSTLLAVKEAGGLVSTFEVTTDRHLVGCDPLDALASKLAVVANNQNALDALVSALHESIRL